MNKKKSIILAIVVLTIVMISGVSFALWQITLKQDSTNVITTGCFKIEFQDENPISLNNAFPITDAEGKELIPYTFTITNTCESYASYQINLEILNNTTLENLDYLKIMFEDNIDLLNKKETASKTLENATTSKKLETGYLDIDESKTYHLRLWMSEDTPNDETFMNKVFQSKITVIATYQTEFDRENPIAVLNATKENGNLTMDASSSTDNTSIKNYYYSLDGENWIVSKNNTYEFQEDRKIEYGVGTNSITSLYNSTIHKVYLKIEDEYGNMSETISTDFLDELEYDKTIDNNLRYIGAEPSNYVSFNDELWRIIGVMNNIEDGEGNKESRIKLIRNESIGAYSWDSTTNDVNGGAGINEWSTSKIKTLLNDFYLNSKANQQCYNNSSGVIVDCDFSKKGLKKESLDFIEPAFWNLGSNGTQELWNNIIPQKFYELERSGNSSKICTNGAYCTDTYSRTTSWIETVGLIYPSDYGYATGWNLTEREKCLVTPVYSWQEIEKRKCYEGNWLYKNSNYWTMMPAARTDMLSGVFSITPSGSIGTNLSHFSFEIFPVYFLKSNVVITDGIGTIEHPYVLSLN